VKENAIAVLCTDSCRLIHLSKRSRRHRLVFVVGSCILILIGIHGHFVRDH